MDIRRCRALVLVGALAWALACGRAAAVNPETLLMPGKLSMAHEKFEQHCSLCHDLRDRSRETGLCLDCHKGIAADIRGRRGFHGRTPAMASSECRACHVEHLGRGADIVELDPARFDHGLTDFPLTGAHRGLPCSDCHLPRKRFRDAPRNCIACHKADDPHGGGLGADCASCHVTDAWEPAHFDHDRTSFPLRGAHAQVACIQCHVNNRYKGTPGACVSCHAPDDVHAGDRGPDCASCHTVTGWKTSRFDHAKETGFALLGAHASLACGDCHRSGNLKTHIPRHCSGCHQGQDPHAGRLGASCDRCHGNRHWTPSTFDHGRQAHWVLTGAHSKAGCFDCHTASVASQKLETRCASCHAPDDVHRGSLGSNCAACHGTRGWLVKVRFDHGRTRFPLAGLHVAVPCAQCHLSRTFRDTPTGCADCHSGNDVHKGGFGRDCARCHSPDGWGVWRFDHARETRFALTGAHAALACSACHRQPAGQVKLPRDCAGCHSQDDVHLGQFGPDCDRCHTTLTFKGAEAH